MHYQRVMKHGTPNGGNGRFATPSEALRHRSERRGECVVWTGHVNQNGYGRMNVGGNRLRVVHHVAWEQENGPIPPDMEIDHICFNRACINVEHMRLVSRRQNTRYRRGAQPNSKSGVRNVIPWAPDGQCSSRSMGRTAATAYSSHWTRPQRLPQKRAQECSEPPSDSESDAMCR